MDGRSHEELRQAAAVAVADARDLRAASHLLVERSRALYDQAALACAAAVTRPRHWRLPPAD